MNTLTDALKLAEETRPAPDPMAPEASCAPAVSGHWPLGSLGVSRDDTGPDGVAPATVGSDASSGIGASGNWPFGPLRASRDDADPGAPVRVVLDGHEPSIPETSAEQWLEPIRATRDDADSGMVAADCDRTGRDAPAPERSPGSDELRGSTEGDSGGREDGMSGPNALGAPIESSAPEPVPVAGESRPAGHRAFDDRALPRRPGIGRAVGFVCALLAVGSAAGGGGYVLWATEFARPALVRQPPSMRVPVMELAPVHLATAATHEAETSTSGTALLTDGRSARSTAEAAAVPPMPVRNDESTESESPAPSSASTGRARAGDLRAGLAESVPAVEVRDRSNAGVWSHTAERPGPISEHTVERREWVSEVAVDHPGPASDPVGDRPGPASEPVVDRSGPAPELAGSRPEPMPEPAFEPLGPISENAVDHPKPALEPDVDHSVPAPEATGSVVRPDSAAGIVIRKRIRADHVADSLERAWEALLAGDGTSAGQMYRAVLGHEPGNRDAHLGLAAVAARAGRWDEAAAHYAGILASHPVDIVARAALIAIYEQDPVRAESRLKTLLGSEPQAAHLHFALGSLYAAQSRWPEAQRAWFDAYRFDRGNADYAYNLAVSLDHLSQARNALGLYREALVLARSGPASFDAAAVRRRIRDLGPPPAAGSSIAPPAPKPAAATPSEQVR